MQSTATLVHQHLKQVSKRKQCQPQDGTEEIQIVAGTVVASPIHPREQVESLPVCTSTIMSRQTAPKELHKSPYTPLLGESYDRDEKDCTHWNADCEQGDLHSFTHLRRVVDEFAAPEMKRLVSWPPSCSNIDLSVSVLGLAKRQPGSTAWHSPEPTRRVRYFQTDVAAHTPQIGLINQCRSLERVPGPFPSHVQVSKLAQFAVDQRQQIL